MTTETKKPEEKPKSIDDFFKQEKVNRKDSITGTIEDLQVRVITTPHPKNQIFYLESRERRLTRVYVQDLFKQNEPPVCWIHDIPVKYHKKEVETHPHHDNGYGTKSDGEETPRPIVDPDSTSWLLRKPIRHNEKRIRVDTIPYCPECDPQYEGSS